MDRREFLVKSALATGAGVLGACRGEASRVERLAVAGTSGEVRRYRVAVTPVQVDLGIGPRFNALGYNGAVPAPEITIVTISTTRWQAWRTSCTSGRTIANGSKNDESKRWHGKTRQGALGDSAGRSQPSSFLELRP